MIKTTQIAILGIALALWGYSIFSLIPEINKVINTPKKSPIKPGFAFDDIHPKLSQQKIVGFMTTKDMSSEKNDGEFLMAQYALAPIALDLNHVQDINILSPTSKEDLIGMLKQYNLKPLNVNQFGKTIAIKTQ